jgi:hypothetical protein
MTTMTMNAANGRTFGGASFRKPSFADIRAAFPDMPAQDGVLAQLGGVLTGVALAAVPFAAIGWLFIAN